MNIIGLNDITGTEYTLVITGDSVNISVNSELLSLSQEQFRKISEMAEKEWGGDKSKDYKHYVKYL